MISPAITAIEKHFETLEANLRPLQRSRRRAAYEQFINAGIPSRREEYFKNTKLQELTKSDLHLFYEPQWDHAPTAQLQELTTTHEGDHLVFYNGYYCKEASAGHGKVAIESIEDTLQEQHCSPFSYLAEAFGEGLMLTLLSTEETTLHLHMVLDAKAEASCFLQHLRIMNQAGSHHKIAIHYHNLSSHKSWFIQHLEVIAAKDSSLQIEEYRPPFQEGRLLASCEEHLYAGATLDHLIRDRNAGQTRTDLEATLKGEAAAFSMGMASEATTGQLSELRTLIHHEASHTSSSQEVRTALSHTGQGWYDGTIHVAEGLEAIKATQESHAHLLHKGAIMKTVPRLEIYSDDVSCAHGATLGFAGAEAIAYGKQRGLGEQEMKELLKQAHLIPILSQLSYES